MELVAFSFYRVECFGLLGVNGAGKTTTFKMMTGDERISSGAAFVQGLSLESNMNSIYKMIGYCPQFDALLDDLTGREVLRIFCMLRGVQEARIRQLSEDLAKSFGFMKHIDKQTHAYSGGNKRKLSTAIAVIGSRFIGEDRGDQCTAAVYDQHPALPAEHGQQSGHAAGLQSVLLYVFRELDLYPVSDQGARVQSKVATVCGRRESVDLLAVAIHLRFRHLHCDGSDRGNHDRVFPGAWVVQLRGTGPILLAAAAIWIRRAALHLHHVAVLQGTSHWLRSSLHCQYLLRNGPVYCGCGNVFGAVRHQGYSGHIGLDLPHLPALFAGHESEQGLHQHGHKECLCQGRSNPTHSALRVGSTMLQ